MKLLVTGGLGFIGSNFILDALKNTNFEILNIDAEFYGSNHYNLMEVENSSKYSFVKGDITDKKLMETLISNCDCVVNFAAESHVDRSILDPSPFLNSNILGTFTILDIIKNQEKRLVHVSTDEVYGTILEGSATENSRFNPSSPYSATKASAELLINSYVKTYGVDAVITRCTNNYGPHQYPEKLIPKTIILAHRNEKIPIYGNGKSIRDWIFVEDHCDAIMKVLFKGNSGETYNISSQNELDNLTIVKKILKLMNKSLDLMEFVNERPGEDHRYSLDSLKIRTKLKWNHKINFEDGIRKTIEWYLIKNPWEKIDSKSLKNIPWKR
jgi:dTDP-glucose 4,6-dehydratase